MGTGWSFMNQEKEYGMQEDHRPGLHAAGEAIGNVGRFLSRRRRRRHDAEQTLQRWMRAVPLPTVSLTSAGKQRPEEDVIEGSWRVLEEDDDDDNEGGES